MKLKLTWNSLSSFFHLRSTGITSCFPPDLERSVVLGSRQIKCTYQMAKEFLFERHVLVICEVYQPSSMSGKFSVRPDISFILPNQSSLYCNSSSCLLQLFMQLFSLFKISEVLFYCYWCYIPFSLWIVATWRPPYQQTTSHVSHPTSICNPDQHEEETACSQSDWDFNRDCSGVSDCLPTSTFCYRSITQHICAYLQLLSQMNVTQSLFTFSFMFLLKIKSFSQFSISPPPLLYNTMPFSLKKQTCVLFVLYFPRPRTTIVTILPGLLWNLVTFYFCPVDKGFNMSSTAENVSKGLLTICFQLSGES